VTVRDCDVAIVGAGLAGLECARLLAVRGLRVVLMDRKADLARGIHTTGIFVRRTLDDYALPADCVGPAIRHVVLYSPAGKALPLASDRDEFRVGRMGALYRRWLDDATDAGAEWWPETRYLGMRHNGSSTILDVERGAGAERVRARFVIGADGTGSRVAADLGLGRNTEFIVGAEDVFHGIATAGPPALHCWVDPNVAPGYIAWVSVDGEDAHVGVGGYRHDYRPVDALRRFRERVDARFGLAGRAMDERRSGRIPVGGVLPRIACSRGLLVGDAAGAVSPLTCGGLDPCLRLSELAAEVAHEFVETGDAKALAPYDGARFRAYFRKRLMLRRMMAAVRSPALLEAGCAMLRSGPLRGIAPDVFFGRGSFPDVPLSPQSRALRRAPASPSTEQPQWRPAA
jgi:flavin-dependent dehydrogenase